LTNVQEGGATKDQVRLNAPLTSGQRRVALIFYFDDLTKGSKTGYEDGLPSGKEIAGGGKEIKG